MLLCKKLSSWRHAIKKISNGTHKGVTLFANYNNSFPQLFSWRGKAVWLMVFYLIFGSIWILFFKKSMPLFILPVLTLLEEMLLLSYSVTVIIPRSCWASSGTESSQVCFQFKTDSARTNIRAITAASVLQNMIIILSFTVLPELPCAMQCPGTSQEAASAPKEPIITKTREWAGGRELINYWLSLY